LARCFLLWNSLFLDFEDALQETEEIGEEIEAEDVVEGPEDLEETRLNILKQVW